jgi:hypothetical protein
MFTGAQPGGAAKDEDELEKVVNPDFQRRLKA